MIKPLFLAILFLFVANSAYSIQWETNLETAQSLAKNSSKKLLMVFSGSDWCAPCMKLEKEIFESQQFKENASSQFVFLKVDFPRKKENRLSVEQASANGKLASEYNPQGYFPLVVVMDANGNVLGNTGYKKNTSPEEYIELLNSF